MPAISGPDDLGRHLDEDLGRYPPAERERIYAMLVALAWGLGNGVPRRLWPVIATAIGGTGRSDADVALTVASAPWYLVEGAEDGQTVYRLYHEELGRHFREATRE
ncbi:hypothetical protein BH18ACT4_BH18ACT4_04540 [soil metagenome]